MSDHDPESFKAGYRSGFEAGKTAAVRDMRSIGDALTALATEPTIARVRVVGPKCVDCGHAFTSHNDLGYCQAKRDRATGSLSGCHCNYPMDAEQRARIDARDEVSRDRGERVDE